MRSSALVGVLILGGCGVLVTDTDPPSFAAVTLTISTSASFEPQGRVAAALLWYPPSDSEPHRIAQPVSLQLDALGRGVLSLTELPPILAVGNDFASARLLLFSDLDGNGVPSLIAPDALAAGGEVVVGSPDNLVVEYRASPDASTPGDEIGGSAGYNFVHAWPAPPVGCAGATCCMLVRSAAADDLSRRIDVPTPMPVSRFACDAATPILAPITSCQTRACEGCVDFPMAMSDETIVCADDLRAYAIVHCDPSTDPALGPVCGAVSTCSAQVISLPAGEIPPGHWPCSLAN